MTHILYISDNNLRLHRLNEDSSHQTVARSQGYAWFKGDQVIFDTNKENAPIKFCRLAPQEMNNRYWQQCDKSSVSSNAVGMRHAADLIWKHLSELKQAHSITDLILVVPSHYRSSNLQLLLGIAQSVDINVEAIFNGALLSLVDTLTVDGHYVHLDVQLHQTVASNIIVVNGVAKLDEVEIIQGVGIQAMQDALLKTLQAHFIQNDRFDPLHHAETEQQLFDDLSTIAVQVNESAKAVVNVSFQNQLYSTSIDAKVWNISLSPFLEQLVATNSKADHVYIQMNAAFEAQSLPSLVSAKSTLINDEMLIDFPELKDSKESDGSLSYITRLELNAPLAPTKIAVAANTPKVEKTLSKNTIKPLLTGATHLLQSGIAVSIEHAELRMENQQLTLHASAKGNAQTLLESGKLIVLSDESCREFRPNDRIGSDLVDGVITVIQVV